jgi:hypothetical protein
MWSLLRKLHFATVLVLLTGCGFQPMYGDAALSGGTNTPMRGNIVIGPIAGHEGQILKIALEDRFNPEGLDTTNAGYRLALSLKKTLTPSVVKSDGTIQRYDVHFESGFQLFKTGSSKPVFTGSLHRGSSYNVAVNANFATYEAEQDVIERSLKEMAEDYVFRITGYLAGKQAP